VNSIKWFSPLIPSNVPEWSGDGDGMIAVQHCAADNAHLESRFDDDQVRPMGYCGFEQLTHIGTWPTLAEAQREMARYAASIGYDIYKGEI